MESKRAGERATGEECALDEGVQSTGSDTVGMMYFQLKYWEEIIALIVFAIAIVVTAILWVIAVYKEKKKRR